MCLFPKIVQVKRGFCDTYSIPAPCGRCPECLKQQRTEWFIRNKIELQNSLNGFFITLTYNQDNLPLSECNQQPCFSKPDIQKFFKRFRKNLSCTGLKYFLAAEYGGQFGRPHYHALIYNIPNEKIPKLSEILDKSWTLGFTSVSPISDRRIGYVTKYMLQKCQRKKDFSDPNLAPFYLSSRNPAIGSQYLTDQNKLWHLANEATQICLSGLSYPLPRYYKRKIFDDYPEVKENIRLNYIQKLENDLNPIYQDNEKYTEYCKNHRQSIANALIRFQRYQKQKFTNENSPEWVEQQITINTN